MLLQSQQRFVQKSFTERDHASLITGLSAFIGHKIEFRILEAPVFCSTELSESVAAAAEQLVQMCVTPAYMQQSQSSLQPEYTVPDETAHPLFSVVDFAIVAENGKLVPRLIELQGFPSLFAYQLLLSEWFNKVYKLENRWSPLFASLTDDDYLHLLHEAIVGKHHPDNVALLEHKPFEQKTLPDFIATRHYLGVEPTDISSVRCVDATLFHERGGALQPLQRIYNRTIIDELNDANVVVPFDWTARLNTEWAGHPNWYFRMSKYSLPYLNHWSVPHTQFVSELQSIPDNLSGYVLKPLYAFAGKGVNLQPTHRDIDALTEKERSQWILMEKLQYADCLYTPVGMNRVELRCMLIWLPNSSKPVPTINLVRTGRGAMMGARFNTAEWSGATVALFGED